MPQTIGKIQDSLDQCPISIQTLGLEGKVQEDILDRSLLEMTRAEYCELMNSRLFLNLKPP